jgi:hypothetical protein
MHSFVSVINHTTAPNRYQLYLPTILFSYLFIHYYLFIIIIYYYYLLLRMFSSFIYEEA